MVIADALEQVIWDTVRTFLKDPDALLVALARWQTPMQQPDERSSRRRELLGEIKWLAKRLIRYLDLCRDGKLDRDTLDSKVDEAGKRRQAVEEYLSRLEANGVSQWKNWEASQNLGNFCRTVSTGLDNLTFEE